MSENDPGTLLRENIIKYKVRAIKTYRYEYNSGVRVLHSKTLLTVDEYNKQGNLILHLTYSGMATPLRLAEHPTMDNTADSTINTYDKNGNLIKKTDISHSASMDLPKFYNRRVKVSYYEYIKHKLTKSSSYANGKLDSTMKYNVNSAGKPTGYIAYDQFSSVAFKYTNLYAAGKLSGSETRNKNDEIVSSSKIMYEDAFHTITTYHHGTNAASFILRTALDDKGQIIMTEMPAINITLKYTYNHWGALKSCITYKNHDEPIQYQEMQIERF